MLKKARAKYKPVIPAAYQDLRPVLEPIAPNPVLQPLFPHTYKSQTLLKKNHPAQIGLLFSGGPAPGGHNVIAGLFDGSQSVTLLGFLDGPAGVMQNRTKRLNASDIEAIRNQGGFDLIGTGREKIETEEQLAAALRTATLHKLDALVVIGGDDSNTNAAVLAEYFLAHNAAVQVIGIPKTIDGDLRSEKIELPFGFDTACKTYNELIGNIAKDALSTKKYYHFIKLMGRSASHIALECALSCQPNLTLISEEKRPLQTIVNELTDLVIRRHALGKEYGLILIPEGLIESIPEIGELTRVGVKSFSLAQKALFDSFPESVQKQLLLDLDPHGNIQVSQIETEKLLIHLVKQALKAKNHTGKFGAQEHFFGYEGRCAFPSNFDANYTYALGLSAAAAIKHGLTGIICGMQSLHLHPERWLPTFIPIVNLMHLETRHGKQKPVIKKALVDLQGKAFQSFAKLRKAWELDDHYRQVGPIQFSGASELTDSFPLSLK
jgi:pyrophosphate--fructose-6-phosphate 1-phosphotransferase